jgi:hypothetical protein
MKPLTHNPARLRQLLAADYLRGPNWYYRIRTVLHGLLLGAPDRLRFWVEEETAYGGVLYFQPDPKNPHRLTKGKLRWSDLAFYGLFPAFVETPAPHAATGADPRPGTQPLYPHGPVTEKHSGN